MQQGYDAATFAVVMIIIVSVAFLVVPIFVSITSAPYNSVPLNLTNNFSEALNTIGKPLFLIPFVVVIVVLAFYAINSIKHGAGSSTRRS